MKYILTSKDGIFYKKSYVIDSTELTSEQIEVDQNTFYSVKLPCKLIEGGYVNVDEYPTLEATEMEISEPEPSLEDDIMAMTIDHEYRITLLELGIAE